MCIRDKYNALLKDYLNSNIDSLCETCKDRVERNPLRVLDCKEEGCRGVIEKAPLMIDHLCDECLSLIHI